MDAVEEDLKDKIPKLAAAAAAAAKSLQSTLRNPMNCSPPGSSIHGIFQARVLEWGAIAFSLLTQYPRPLCCSSLQPLSLIPLGAQA